MTLGILVDDREVEIDFSQNMVQGEMRVPPVPTNTVIKKKSRQTQLVNKRPSYYGLKINETELVSHNKTILEIVTLYGWTTWVVGRDEALCKKGVPHYHIHFKSDKTIEALRKQKQSVMPHWGHSTKMGPPKKDHVDDWYCWAGYAVKEKIIGMSGDMTEEDIQEIKKHAHTQAVIKKSKLDWSNKQDEKKQEKKDLETRLYEQLDKDFPLYYKGDLGKLAVKYCEAYFNEIGEMPCATAYKSKCWKYLYLRKHISMDTYVYYTSDFFSMTNI